MAGAISIGRTGIQDTDGILSGTAWGTLNLTYSFPTSAADYSSGYGSGEPGSNFQGMNAQQQGWARSVLKSVADLTNLSFTQVTETTTTHADLRFAMTDKVSTAWAYTPSWSPSGGDAWFRNSGGMYDTPTKGNYAAYTFLHEIGHTLGLDHAHSTDDFGAVTAAHDSIEYTVMSYRSFVGAGTGGLTNETWGYPQTFMMVDIAALQAMYGADFTVNSGNTTYKWSPTTGEMFINGAGQGAPGGNKVFMTVWDGGGVDTYDLSNYAGGVTIDLRPGQWTTTSSAQKANLGGGHSAAGTIANALQYHGDARSLIENAIGGAGNDTIYGNAASNTVDGGAGTDTVILAGSRSDYGFSGSASNLKAVGFGATDTLLNVEYIKFAGSGSTVATSSLGGTTTSPTGTTTPPPTGTTPSSGTIMGTASNDTITLSAPMQGGKVDLLAGADTLTLSSAGPNTVTVFNTTTIIGGTANDTVTLGTVMTTGTVDLGGGTDKLTLSSAGGNTLRVSNTETIIGSGYGDTITLGTKLVGGTVELGGGADRLNLSSAGDNDVRTVSVELVVGGSAKDKIVAAGPAARLEGWGGNDSLIGGTGNDELYGGSGVDLLTGGSGNDRFIFKAVADSPTGMGDRITDFNANGDLLVFGGLQKGTFEFRGAAAFSATGHSEARYVESTHQLTVDVDGNGSADMQVTLDNVTLASLSKADFLWV